MRQHTLKKGLFSLASEFKFCFMAFCFISNNHKPYPYLNRVKDYSIYTWDKQDGMMPQLEDSKQSDEPILVDYEILDETDASVDLEDRQTYTKKRQLVMNNYLKGVWAEVVGHCLPTVC